MACAVRILAVLLLAVVPAAGFAQTQGRGGSAGSSASVGGFEFKNIGGDNYQVYQGPNKVVAMVVNGHAMSFLPSVKADDVQAAFDAFKKGGPTGGAGGADGSRASKAGFDTATQTATLADGGSVTFVDAQNVTVRNASGTEFQLTYHGGSAGGFFKSVTNSARGNVGASLSGSGVAISTQGRKAWDTADGANTPSTFEKIRPIAQQVFDAANLAKTAGHPIKSDVVDSLASNSVDLHAR